MDTGESEARLEALDCNRQAALLIRAGNPEQAREKLEQALNLDPMTPDTYQTFGELCMAQGQYEEAKAYYRKGLLLEGRGEFYFHLGSACFLTDDPHEGLKNYQLAISAGFDGDDMMYFMGIAYEHLDDDEMALRYFRKAIAKNPSKPDYQVKAILALIRLDSLERAEAMTDELLRTAPELFDGYHLKTQLLLRRGSSREARDFAERAAKRFPEDADLMFDYIKCLALNQEYEFALRELSRARRMRYFSEASQDFTFLEAQIAAETQDYDRAMDCCRRCIAEETEGRFRADARFLLMNLALFKRDYAETLRQAEALVAGRREDNFYYAALYYRALSLRQTGQNAASEKAYREANAFYRLRTLEMPEAVELYLYRAMCLKDMGDYGKALDMLNLLLNIGADFAEVHMLKAEIYDASGQSAQSEAERERACQLKPALRPAE